MAVIAIRHEFATRGRVLESRALRRRGFRSPKK